MEAPRLPAWCRLFCQAETALDDSGTELRGERADKAENRAPRRTEIFILHLVSNDLIRLIKSLNLRFPAGTYGVRWLAPSPPATSARTVARALVPAISARRMLEVLFDDDSSGSDDVPSGGRPEPLPNAPSSGSQPEWQQHVADELTALHLALETRARALNEREAALA